MSTGKHVWSDNRKSARRPVALPARMTWKDQRGIQRFASVTTRDVSDHGVYVECQSVVSIPLYRLVQFQFEKDVRTSDALPEALRDGRVWSAVYRVKRPTQDTPQGLALRLMIEPRRLATGAADAEIAADTDAARVSA